MQVYIKSNKTNAYNIDLDETVESLKDKIYKREKIEPKYYFLAYAGKPLYKGKLVEFGIIHGATIFLNTKLCSM